MSIIPVLFLALGFTSALFAMGRLLQPSHDRIGLRSMDNLAVVQTLARGWNAIASNHSLERITDQLAARRSKGQS